ADFKEFDDDVKSSKSKKEALMVLLRVLIYGQTTSKGCICKIASALLTKSVESHYSGTGKIIKGVGKLNFSSTETYKCMRDILPKNLVILRNAKILPEKLANGCLVVMTESMGEKKDLSRHKFFFYFYIFDFLNLKLKKKLKLF
ncbi:GSCOCG00012258001-RA-CDS, partial [Cotesia congregata]